MLPSWILVASISMPGPSCWLPVMECIMKPPAEGSSGRFKPTMSCLDMVSAWVWEAAAPPTTVLMTCLATQACQSCPQAVGEQCKEQQVCYNTIVSAAASGDGDTMTSRRHGTLAHLSGEGLSGLSKLHICGPCSWLTESYLRPPGLCNLYTVYWSAATYRSTSRQVVKIQDPVALSAGHCHGFAHRQAAGHMGPLHLPHSQEVGSALKLIYQS